MNVIETMMETGRYALGGILTPSATVLQPDGTRTTWVSEMGLGETEYLQSVLRAACYTILASLTGMRDGELQALTRKSSTVRDGLPALDSREFKGYRSPEGFERSWWAPAAVMRSVDVLKRLSIHPVHLFARDELNAGDYEASRDIPRLISFVNDDPSSRPGRGSGLGLDPIVLDQDAAVNATTLRRSLSVYCSTKPEAEMGLGIQLGHAAIRTTTGYMVDGQEQAVRLMDETRLGIVREQAAALLHGVAPVAGFPARDILTFRAQIVEDPHRAKRLIDQLGSRLHLGVTNDCMYNPVTAACGTGGPKLGDHLCAGPDCTNALVTEVHRKMLEASVERIDGYLEGDHAHPDLVKQMRRDRANLCSLLRELDVTDIPAQSPPLRTGRTGDNSPSERGERSADVSGAAQDSQ
jgi:hypothetical protein